MFHVKHRRKKNKKRSAQRGNQLHSNQRLLSIYDQNQKQIKRRLKRESAINSTGLRPKRLIDRLRRYQNLRALVFASPQTRAKRILRKPISKIKLLYTHPIHDLICANRKARKIMMFVKGNVGHGTATKRRKMTWTSKVRC